MITVAAIVEGYGDVQAFPVLLSKMGHWIGLQIVTPKPIKAGEWPKLKLAGRLERYLDLAASREADRILIALDLDDGCPVEEATIAAEKIEAWKNGRDISVAVVFIAREYETLFLQDTSSIGLPRDYNIGTDPLLIRGAKEKIRELTGRRYRETQDQAIYTSRLNLPNTYSNSRAFRKLCRAIFEMEYEMMDLLLDG